MGFSQFAPTFLRVKNKQARIVPFHLNVVQQRLDAIVEERLAAGRPVRIIVLKARQEGISTYSLGRMYYTCSTTPYTDSMMLCHDDESSLKLFNRLKIMHELAPAKPMTRYSTRRILDFRNPKSNTEEPGMMSTCSVATAGRKHVGRSETLRFVHCSEVAFWDNADNILLGLEQTLPMAPGTVEILESTANGVGNEFHARWLRASDPRKAGEWIPVFFPWWSYPDYRLPVDENGWYPVPSSVDDVSAFERDEQEQKRLYGLDDDQLNWRRYTITNACGNKLELFKQEYPANPDEAFLSTGRPVFNIALINRRIEVLRKAEDILREKRQGPRFHQGRLQMVQGAAVWNEHPDGDLRVYEWPEPNGEYMIAADVAEGITKGNDSDESAVSVMDRYSWHQMAVYQGRIPPTRFADVLMTLGYFYNTALIGCEVNNHGHTVNLKMAEAGYPNLYYRRDYDRLGNPVHEKVGWETNRRTRPLLVDALDDTVNRNLARINDIPMLKQMLSFVYNPDTGKQEGAKRCHDDLVIAQGIACAIMSWSDHPRIQKTDVGSTLSPSAQLHQRFIRQAWKQAKKRHSGWGYVN